MRYREIHERLFYHSCSSELDIGTILTGRDSDYEKDWGYVPFYQVLEKYRPAGMLGHKDSVFMVADEDDLDSAGGSTEYVFTLKPMWRIEKHDMNWSSRISSLVDDGLSYDDPKIVAAANAYWNGEPSDDPMWEYLTDKVVIIHAEEY